MARAKKKKAAAKAKEDIGAKDKALATVSAAALKAQGLDGVIKLINDTYGEGTIMQAGCAPGLALDRISSGMFVLDQAIGGGWPRGRISMLKGEFSSGKSVVTLMGMAEAQRCDRFTGKPFKAKMADGSFDDVDFGGNGRSPEPMRVVAFDAERAFDYDWAAKWGVDVDNLYLLQPEYTEQGIDIADMCIRSGQCDYLVIDSIAAMTPSVEVTDSVEKWHIGVAPRLITKALRKWTSGLNSLGLLAKTKCTILLVNQMRVDIPPPGSRRKARLTSPGGKGLDHFASIEVRFSHIEDIDDPTTGRLVGAKKGFYIKKNRTAPKSKGGLFRLFYAHAPALGYCAGQTDIDAQILRAAFYWGLVERKGTWFSLVGGEKKIQGADSFVQFVRERPQVLENLATRVRECEHQWLEFGTVPEGINVESEEAVPTNGA